MNTQDKMQDRVLALAGIFQIAGLVKQLARTGKCQEPYFSTSIDSIFKIHAQNVPAIYGGIQNLVLGLQFSICFIIRKHPRIWKLHVIRFLYYI
jgi:high frequency lysogenization protein